MTTPRPGTLSFFGLGVCPPASLTAETLDLLAREDEVLCDGADSRALRFLAAAGVRARAVDGSSAASLKKAVVEAERALRAGRSAAYAAPGHGLSFGPLARALHEKAAALGAASRFHYALSTLDAVLAVTGEILGISVGAIQVVERLGPNPPPLAREGGVAARVDAAQDPKALFAYLARQLAKDRPCLFFPKQGDWWGSAEKTKLDALARKPRAALTEGLLYFPAP